MQELGLYDIHCHIVPGVDDGAVNLEEAVKMVEQYLDIRIRRIPLQKNALMVTGESMTFFGKFLR